MKEQILQNLVSEVLQGMIETKDKETLKRYKRILKYLNLLTKK